VQEKVSTTQQLGIVGLAEEVIYVTGGAVKVNLLEAVLAETSIPIPQILYNAVNYTFADDKSLLQTVLDRLTPEMQAIYPSLLTPAPDYRSISSLYQSKPAPSPIECHNCNQLLIPSIAQICEHHKFCSEDCLSAVRNSSGLQSTHCPLCTVKVSRPRKGVMAQKKPEEGKSQETSGKCAKCGRRFDWNGSEGWRLDKLGSSEYERVKLYCSEDCYAQENQAKRVEIRAEISLLCVVCGQTVSNGKILHCRQHGICSPRCLSCYYHNNSLAQHQYGDGTFICYQCLEQYLEEVGSGDGLSEIQLFRRKLAYF
jgi:hypothetical protein